MNKKTFNTLFVTATHTEFGLGVVQLPHKLVDEIRLHHVDSVCIWKQAEHDKEVFQIYYCRKAELDYNGHDFYLRFYPTQSPVATYPGTGMYTEFEVLNVIKHEKFMYYYEIVSPNTMEKRKLPDGLHFGQRMQERVKDYTAHLDIKEMTIGRIEKDLAKHQAFLRKDYWIWEDDFRSNGLSSLTCPILIEPHQLQELLLAASQNKLDFKK